MHNIARVVRCLAPAVIFIVPSASVIASEQTGVVSVVFIRASDGLIYFELVGGRTAKPPCATRSYWMIGDENSNAGKQQYALLMVAQASGQTVRVSGTSTCARWGDGEDVDAIWMQK